MFGLLAGVGAGLNILGGVGKLISGSKRARRAQKAIDSYQRQTLTNAYDGVGVSRLGADLQREENARVSATTIDALRSFGTRGLAGLGGTVRSNNLMNREAAADLDRQRQTIDMARAGDEARIRQMQEKREELDLQGLGQQLNVGRQDAYSGFGDIASSIGSIGAMGQLGAFNNPTPNVNPVPNVLGTRPMVPGSPATISAPLYLG